MPLAVYRDVQLCSVTCITMMNGCFSTNIMSTLYDHAEQYDDEHTCHVMERWKLHGNIFQNGYGNAMIGRYGGYFEEDIRRLMCDRVYHITGFDALVKFAPTLKVRKNNARYSFLNVRTAKEIT